MLRLTAFVAPLSFLVAIGANASPIHLPDVRTGVINGRVATLVWPARYSVDPAKPELLDAENCSAHFVSTSNLDREEVHPCGRWLRPRPDTYRVWLELNGSISPFPSLLRYSDVAGDRGVVSVMPVVPAGIVKAAKNSSRSDQALSLRLLSLNTHFLGHLQRVFDRRVAKGESRTSMPAGKVVAGLFDRASGHAIALSKPVSVTAGATSLIDPQRPAADSDVLVILQRAAFGKEGDIRLLLADERGSRPPDVFVPASDAVFAIWYGAVGKWARVTGESPTFFLSPITLTLQEKQVSTFRGRLNLLPKISVSILAPGEPFSKAEIIIRRSDELDALRRLPMTKRATLEIGEMPLEILDVILSLDGWEFKERVDLRDGSDRTVVFALQPLIVRGTIYWGDARAPGKVSFAFSERQSASFESDTNGDYEGILWKPALYPALVTLTGHASVPPFFELVDVDASTTFDFHIPRNRVIVHVTDARDGRPIPGATVGVDNVWQDRTEKEVNISQPYVADESGTAVMPPLHAGKVRIHVTADRYVSGELEVFEIGSTEERELTIALRPASVRQIQVLLPTTSPAAAAEAAVIAGFGQVLWRGLVDPAGNLDVPTTSGEAVLVIRHQNAASAAHSLRTVPETVALRHAAPIPLLLRTTAESGDARRFAFLTIWIDGFPLTGAAAAFATWTPIAATDANAMWVGRNLPAAAARVLATKGVSPDQIASGAFDRLATTIPYPWQSSAVTIKPIEH